MAGVITDAGGGVVQGVELNVSELDTGRSWIATSDNEGRYRFATLPTGTYRLTARRDGFKTFVAEPIRLDSNQAIRVDIVFEPGSFDERVEVLGRSPRLQSQSTDVKFTIDANDVAGLPTVGRNVMTLMLLKPGAIATNPASFTNGLRTTSAGRPYFNGNRKEANNYQLDGVDNNQTTDNLLSYQPSPDAIGEVTVMTNNAPAEFGNYQGAIVNVVLKSGTNALHGTLFEFLRHDALNATGWSANRQPIDPLNPRRKAPLRHNVFGGTAGGPLVRNRAFFFVDYQGTRRHAGQSTGLLSFITPAMRRGDFSALLDGPNPQQLYNPFTTRPDPSNPDRSLRDPFPGNQIPLSRINPAAAALFASRFYPEPHLAAPLENTFNTTTNTLDNDQFDVKTDIKFSGRDDVSARYAHGLQTTAATNSLPILMVPATRSPFRAAALQWVRQLGPHVINEARIGFNRIVARDDGGLDLGGIGPLGESIGIRGANRVAPGLPGINFGGAAASVGSPKVVQSFTTNTFQYQDHLMWRHGAHAFKAGFLALRYQQNVYFSGNNGQLGVIEFNGQYTRDLNDPRSIGSPIADFFLGYPRRMARGDFAGTWGHRSTLWAGFFQDDWRASRNLTLNLGLRYEYRTPFAEVHDRQVNFDLVSGRALYAGQDGNSRSLYEAYARDWQPRVGLAWTPERWRDRLVLRGAYGISSFLEGTGTNLRLTLNPPFFNEFETINGNPAVLGSSIDQGFDTLREKDPLTGTILRAWDPKHRPARSHQWHATLESSLPNEVTVSVGYVGQYGNHLVVPVNFNQRTSPDGPRPFDATYPQISGVILTAPNANQRYDALQATARRRLDQGWSVITSYTLSRGLTHGRGFFSDGGQGAEQASFWPDPRNRGAEWGPVPFDARHNLAVAGLWELPRLTSAPRWLHAVTSNWTVAAVWKAHTGFPITVVAPDQSQTGARSGRPDHIGQGRDPHEVGPGRRWFDTSVFVLPRPGTFGNAKVGPVRGPGFNVVDMAVSKIAGLPAGMQLELRGEAFNLFNTPVFNAPDRNLTSATFGQVLTSQLAREVQLAVKLSF